MKITSQQLEIFIKYFNLNDKFGNEEIINLQSIEFVESLNQYLISFKLSEGSTEIGFKNNVLIVGGNHVSVTEPELIQINFLIKDNKMNIVTSQC